MLQGRYMCKITTDSKLEVTRRWDKVNNLFNYECKKNKIKIKIKKILARNEMSCVGLPDWDVSKLQV